MYLFVGIRMISCGEGCERPGIFIVDFEHMQHSLVILSQKLNIYPAGAR